MPYDALAELEFQHELIERMLADEPATDILTALCLHLEAQLPGTRANVVMMDQTTGRMTHLVAPSFSPSFVANTDEIANIRGAGLSAAAARAGHDLIVEDVYEEPILAELRELIDAEGSRAIWAHLLVQDDGTVYGTLTVHWPVPHRPTVHETMVVGQLGHIASITLSRATVRPRMLRGARTGLARALPDRLRTLALLNRWLDDPHRRPTVFCIDIGGIDLLDDHLEQRVRDALMDRVAERIRGAVGRTALLGRLEEAKFLVATHAPSRDDAERIAQRLLEGFETSYTVEDGEFALTAAVGIVVPEEGLDAYGVYQHARITLTEARGDSSRYRFFDRGLQVAAKERLAREAELRRAIQAREFALVYQPVLGLASDRFSYAEALVRWRHPERGNVAPDEFIPLAEATGLIVPLGEQILDLAVAQATAWRATVPHLRITVNLSAVQLGMPHFADHAVERIEAAGLSDRIVFEVTESALMENFETGRAALECFRRAGSRIVIDDFGTGHSSLARLDELPADGLKVDRKFIQRLTADGPTSTVVRAIVEVGKAYGMVVTAEGVEDAETLQALRELGVDYAQGFFLSRPEPAEELTELLRSGWRG